MKLIHVCGLVVSVHAAVFVVIFATPGCRSTGRPKPVAEATAPTPVTPVTDTLQPGPAMDYNALNPGASSISTAPAAFDGQIRFAPTRPSAATDTWTDAPPISSTSTHTVAKGDTLWTLSRQYGVSVGELATANNLAKTATLRIGQSLTVPAKAASAVSGPAAEATNAYTVVSGDTLGAIARKQGTTITALRTANNLKNDNLRIGQKLVIPGNAVPVSTSTSSAPASVVAPAATAAPRAGSGIHTVVPGDTLGSIARKYGVRVGDLATLNTITDPAKIRVGQELKLPAAAKSAATAPVVTPTPYPVIEEPVAPTLVTPVEPATTVTPVTPMAVPVIRID